jgi:hypothetical protein
MTALRRLWVPLLVSLLVAGVLSVGGGAATAAEPRLTTASIMIPAAAFIPTYNSDYFSLGLYLAVASGSGSFTAPLSFPVQVVNIKKITAYAYDDSSGASVCVSLYRARPMDASEDYAAQVCTADGTAVPQYAATTVISPRRVNTAFHAPYLWVVISGPDVKLYGVKVNYSYTR